MGEVRVQVESAEGGPGQGHLGCAGYLEFPCASKLQLASLALSADRIHRGTLALTDIAEPTPALPCQSPANALQLNTQDLAGALLC